MAAAVAPAAIIVGGRPVKARLQVSYYRLTAVAVKDGQHAAQPIETNFHFANTHHHRFAFL